MPLNILSLGWAGIMNGQGDGGYGLLTRQLTDLSSAQLVLAMVKQSFTRHGKRADIIVE